MALVLHKVLQDGSVAHEDFSRASWERAMGDLALARFWGHAPEDCHDPVTRLWEKLGRRVEPGEEPREAPPPAAEPAAWPPEVALSSRQLAQLSGMAEADCEDLASPHEDEATAAEPLADRDGQLSLF